MFTSILTPTVKSYTDKSIRTQLYGITMTLASPSTNALTALIIFQLVMLTAMFTQTEPHPPLTIPLFAMGPFLGAAIALAVCAILSGSEATRPGRYLAILATIAALLSFGPQKWFDPLFPQIWPAVIGAQICAVVIALRIFERQKDSKPAN